MDPDLKPLLLCDLCKNILQDPRYLHCLHTFCRACIKDDIKHSKIPESSPTYYCPKCSRVKKFPNDVSITKWADVLPKNLLASNVIDAYKLKTGNVTCKPCERKRKSAGATKWCSKCKEPLCDTCVESHNSFKTTMGHETVTITELKNLNLKELILPPSCEEHQEDLDSYCYDHKCFVCQSCKANTHRSCKSVFPVAVYAERVRDESKTLSHSLGQHERNAKTILDNRMDEKEKMELNKTKIKDQIVSVRQKINELLTKYEKQCIKELEDIHSKEKHVLDTDILGVQGIYNTSQNMHSFLKAASKHANDVHFIEWQGKIEKESSMLNDLIYDIHEPLTSPRITFTVNPDLEKVLQSVRNLGGFTIKKENVKLIAGLEKPDEIMQNNKDVQQDNISMLSLQLPSHQFIVKTPSDEHACFITGMAVLPNEMLVCADKNNSKMKVFDSDFHILYEHRLKNPPFDVTPFEGNTVATTIPRESAIFIFTVDSTFSFKKSVKTREAAYGLAYSKKRFAYTCPFSKPVCVRMMSDSGQEVMNICPEENFQSLFLRPFYVKFDSNGSHLYVSDCNRAQIYCCVGNSLRRFSYTHERLNAPRGLTVKGNNDFFAVGWASDNVHFVGRNGGFIREVANRWNGTFSPQTICLSQKEDFLAISLDQTSCNSDAILIFDLSGDLI